MTEVGDEDEPEAIAPHDESSLGAAVICLATAV